VLEAHAPRPDPQATRLASRFVAARRSRSKAAASLSSSPVKTTRASRARVFLPKHLRLGRKPSPVALNNVLFISQPIERNPNVCVRKIVPFKFKSFSNHRRRQSSLLSNYLQYVPGGTSFARLWTSPTWGPRRAGIMPATGYRDGNLIWSLPLRSFLHGVHRVAPTLRVRFFLYLLGHFCESRNSIIWNTFCGVCHGVRNIEHAVTRRNTWVLQ
jgi:hypothetical protein